MKRKSLWKSIVMARTKKEAAIAEIGKDEIRWVSYYDAEKNLKYVVTSNKDGTMHYLYDGNYNKLGRAKSPLELQEKYM